MKDIKQRSVTASIAGAIFLGTYFVSAWLFAALLLGMLGWALIDEWPRLIGYNIEDPTYWGISLFYPIIPFMVLIVLVLSYRSMSYFLPLYPFIASWMVDTGAYLVGNRLGKHKLCPSISPGKTWEGFFGGIFALFVFHLMVLVWYHAYITMPDLFMSTISVGIAAVIGDLFISWLKRRKKLKDTGNLLPGHGGLLDRIDSVLFIALNMAIFELIRVLF